MESGREKKRGMIEDDREVDSENQLEKGMEGGGGRDDWRRL